MRRTFAYSIDREALAEQVGSDVQVAYGIIPPAVRQLGRSYRDLSSDKQFDCYDMDNAAASFDRAETALGNISFDNVKILVCSSTVDSGYIHYLVQSWQDTLGFYVGIEEVTQSEFYQRIEEGDYKIALYPVRGTFNSGLSVIDQFETVECLKSGYGAIRTLTISCIVIRSRNLLTGIQPQKRLFLANTALFRSFTRIPT